jgi:hypothetical protein
MKADVCAARLTKTNTCTVSHEFRHVLDEQRHAAGARSHIGVVQIFCLTSRGPIQGRRRAVADTTCGTAARGPAPEERSPGGRRSICCRRARTHRLARSYAGGDDGTHAHNTLSADNTDVQVFYPFHPLHGVALRVLRRPDRGDGAVCVMDPAGRRLKIPIWMLLPECAEITISQRPHLGKQALLSLASLITSQLDSQDPVRATLRQTRVSRFEGGRRGATSTSGPDDPKGMRCRANGRSDTRQSDRSHGPGSRRGPSPGGERSQ